MSKFSLLYTSSILIILLALSRCLQAQESHELMDEDTLGKIRRQPKLVLTTYVRFISNNKGEVRYDENIVPNIRITDFLRVEAGLRYGEKPALFNAYFHYKLEVQSKFFWKKVRVLARVSDNAVNYASPTYRKTNELFLVEGRQLIVKRLQASLGLGYLFSTQENYAQQGGESRVINESPFPTNHGSHVNSPMFKIALKYELLEKAAVEAAWGSYDVFNPYSLNTPFTQVSGEYELTERFSLTSYARYQYQYNLLRPYNYFLSVGVVYRK